MACRTCDMIGVIAQSRCSPSLAEASMPLIEAAEAQVEKKVKRKASAYSKKYGKAFKKVAKNSRKEWIVESQRIQECSKGRSQTSQEDEINAKGTPLHYRRLQ